MVAVVMSSRSGTNSRSVGMLAEAVALFEAAVDCAERGLPANDSDLFLFYEQVCVWARACACAHECVRECAAALCGGTSSSVIWLSCPRFDLSASSLITCFLISDLCPIFCVVAMSPSSPAPAGTHSSPVTQLADAYGRVTDFHSAERIGLKSLALLTRLADASMSESSAASGQPDIQGLPHQPPDIKSS
jgi:hypothetical protein